MPELIQTRAGTLSVMGVGGVGGLDRTIDGMEKARWHPRLEAKSVRHLERKWYVCDSALFPYQRRSV